ncbi:DUF1007 family protein [Aestuariivirga sp.]|uniref:DUF1007 family protein n=1 Tax=Aestuariivirga sp. TaxID=2650926 RepID=UPI003BAAE6A1
MRHVIRRWTALPIFAIALAAGAIPAAAHPHVWIDMRSDIVFNDQGLVSAVNLMWTFDDAYAEMAMEGLDVNKDGVYDPSELEPLTKENLDSLKDYDYFTYVRFDGRRQPVGLVTEAGQIYSNNKLQLHLQVPLKTPLDPTKGEFVLKVYDPDFFIAFDYVKDEPVSVIGTMPKSCKLVVKPVPTDAELEQTRTMLASKGKEWKPENDEDFGGLFAQPVTIQCKA